MFYGAFDEKTAIAEVCSDPSDLRPLVTVGRFGVTNPMRVIDLSAIPDVPSQFDRKMARQRAASIFLQGFLKDFIEPVVKDGREQRGLMNARPTKSSTYWGTTLKILS